MNEKQSETKQYFAISVKPGAMFQLEHITIEKGKVVVTESSEVTFLPIILGQLMKTLQKLLSQRHG